MGAITYILKMILVGGDLYDMGATQQHGVTDLAFFIVRTYLLVLLICRSSVSRCSFSNINALERFEAMGSSRSSPLICLH